MMLIISARLNIFSCEVLHAVLLVVFRKKLKQETVPAVDY